MWNTSAGLKQFYTDSGNTDGIPVVFIHGFPFDHTAWDGQVKALPAGYRAITYDVRGHGQSEAGEGPYSIEFMADDLENLIQSLNLEKPVLCGLSMGGYIALRAFERNPAGYRAMVLCDTRAETDTNEAKIKRAANVKLIRQQGTVPYADNSVNGLFWEDNVRAGHSYIQKVHDTIVNTAPDVLCDTLMALAARTETVHVLRDIKVPVLIMVGEHDAITPPIAAETMLEHMPHATLKIIHGAAHLSNLENEAVFNVCLAAFLAEIQ